MFGCVRMRPNAFGDVWTSLDGFGRFCFFPHKPGVGKFLFKDSLCFCAVSLPTCSVFAWGWKFLTSMKWRRSRLTLLDKAKPFSDAFGSSEVFWSVRTSSAELEVWIFSFVLNLFWKCSDALGLVRMCWDASGMRLEVFGRVWMDLDDFVFSPISLG